MRVCTHAHACERDRHTHTHHGSCKGNWLSLKHLYGSPFQKCLCMTDSPRFSKAEAAFVAHIMNSKMYNKYTFYKSSMCFKI